MRGDSGLSNSKLLLAQKIYNEKHKDDFKAMEKVFNSKKKEDAKKSLWQRIKGLFIR